MDNKTKVKKPAKQKVPKMVKSEAPKSAPEKPPTISNKQKNEFIVLVVVVVSILTVLYVTTRPPSINDNNTGDQIIPTEFDTNKIDTIKLREDNYPILNTDNLGKDNPFGL